MARPWSVSMWVALIFLILSEVGCEGPNGSAVVQEPAASQPGVDQPASQPNRVDLAEARSVVLEPSTARPVFLQAGESFYCLMRVSKKLGKSAFISLVNADVGSIRFSLRHATPLAVTQTDRHGAVVLEVPVETPDGLYDLVVQGQNEVVTVRHCVKVVGEFKTTFRFVHLSDMNIGDPSAPEFDLALAQEINLLNPAFIVATGDYVDWASVLDKPLEWKRILDFFARFDAPVYLACGDQDHEEGFTTFVANSLVGSFSYGSYHGIVLFDHSRRPVDDEQIRWLRKDLEENRDATFNIIVTHNDDLAFLDYLAKEVEDLSAFLSEYRVKMIFTGGHADWDFQEYASKLKGLDGVHYIRTHQASTCLRGRATGVSHYRVIEVDGESVRYMYNQARAGTQQSIGVGRLRTFYEGPNDGTRTTVVVSVQNSLNQVFEDCRLKLRVAKNPTKKDTEPVVSGGTLRRTLDAGTHWLCEIRVDLPDKGGVRVMASTQDRIPPPIALEVSMDGASEIRMTPRTTKQGLKYFTSEASLAIVLANTGQKVVKARPVVRLDGNVLRVDKKHINLWPVELAGGKDVTLRLRLQFSQVDPGPHLLQVFFLEDPLRRIKTFPVTLKIGP